MKTRKNISCFAVCDNITSYLAERKIRTKGAEYGKYDVIDRKEFERADYFYYFMSVGTTIEFTVKLDVTAAIERCRRLPYILVL